jgi:hypothetical protein
VATHCVVKLTFRCDDSSAGCFYVGFFVCNCVGLTRKIVWEQEDEAADSD